MKNSNIYNSALFTDADFKKARDSWRLDLCGNESTNSRDVYGVSDLLRMRDEDSDDLRASMNKAPDAPILFGNTAPTVSGDLKLQYDRILRMVLPFGTVGCRSYRSEELLNDVLFALEWMHDNMYGENLLTDSSFRSWKDFDWWDWYVGAACPLMDVLMIIEDFIPEALTQKYIVPISFLRFQMRTAPTAAEAMSRIVTLTPLALITRDRSLMQTLFKECEMLLEEHDSGDNMRRDFCCMTHGMPYNVTYGAINLSRIAKTVQILARSPLAYPLKNLHNLKGMLRYTFAPIMYRGKTLAPMNGRAMQYDSSASSILKDVHYLYGIFDEDFDDEISKLIHRNASQEVRDQLVASYGNGMTLEKYRIINSFPGTRFAEAPKTHIYSYSRFQDALNNEKYNEIDGDSAYFWYSGDIGVQHRHSCMIGLRMPSARSLGYECMNGDNGDGWYTGEGALYLYTPSGEGSYSPKWWDHADKHLIPGTTVDDRRREIMFFNKAWRCNRHFVGGVCLDGEYMTASMDYEAFHNEIDEGRTDTGYGRSLPIYKCTLTANKSYFFFSKAILCLGSDINAADGYSVRTIVENRMLENDECIIADGIGIPFSEKVISLSAERIFIPRAGGFIFPCGGNVKLKYYQNDGIRYASVYIDHGVDPQGEKYAYIILPNASWAETRDYLAKDIEILQNDCKIQAAKENSSSLCGVIFREACEFDQIEADQPMIAMLRKDESESISAFTVCDPTQRLEKISFKLKQCHPLSSSDIGIDMANAIDNICVSITTDSARGRTYSFIK